MAEQTVELAPGESKAVSFEVAPNEARTYQVSVNGLNGSFVTRMPLVPYPALEVVTWSWLPHNPPFNREETIGMKVTLRSLSSALFNFHTRVSCQDGAFSSGGPEGILQPGETREFSAGWTNVWFRTSDTVILEIMDEADNVLDSIRANFTVT